MEAGHSSPLPSGKRTETSFAVNDLAASPEGALGANAEEAPGGTWLVDPQPARRIPAQRTDDDTRPEIMMVRVWQARPFRSLKPGNGDGVASWGRGVSFR